MIENFNKARKKRDELDELAFELVLNEIRLCTTMCRVTARHAPIRKREEYERMARKRLGTAAGWLCDMTLTGEQSTRFEKAFRKLAACLPIRPIATVTPIDSLKKLA